MAVEHIRLSQQAKEQLIRLKRLSGIKNWNVLCRWAFCVSLADQSIPSDLNISSDSNVEMDWKTFGGEYASVYWALLTQRCCKDGLPTDKKSLNRYFRLHLHRGISCLATTDSIRSIQNLVALSLTA